MMDENTVNPNVPIEKEQKVNQIDAENDCNKKDISMLSQKMVQYVIQNEARFQKINSIFQQKIDELQAQNEDYKNIIEQQDAEISIIQENNNINMQRSFLIILKKCQTFTEKFKQKCDDFSNENQQKLDSMNSKISMIFQKYDQLNIENKCDYTDSNIKEKEEINSSNKMIIKEDNSTQLLNKERQIIKVNETDSVEKIRKSNQNQLLDKIFLFEKIILVLLIILLLIIFFK